MPTGNKRYAKPAGSPARVLLVDDDPLMRRAYGRILREIGMTVDEADQGQDALQMLRLGGYDAVISDIAMPCMDGLELMRETHVLDIDMPFVLMSGTPSIQGVLQAMHDGALRYLTKPVSSAQLCETVEVAVRHYRHTVNARHLAERMGNAAVVMCPADLDASLDRALASLYMAYQPILCAATGRRMGYEALVRGKEPALPDPGALLAAAERLGRLDDVGRTIRGLVGNDMARLPREEVMFVNLHAQDLDDDLLFTDDDALAPWARRIVLEVTERAALQHMDEITVRVGELRRRGYRIALDDLGAGYAGLSSLAYLEPEVVKLDMSLVRGLPSHPVKRRIVRSVVEICHDLGGQVVAEGVETAEERDAVLELGCDLLQGYLLGRPAPMPRVSASMVPVLHSTITVEAE